MDQGGLQIFSRVFKMPINIIGVAFMPISMITGYISGLVFKLEGWIAPYPIGIFHTLVFVLVFFVVVIASYIILKKQTK